MAIKVGSYEDSIITDLIQYDDYWDRYSYYENHHDMYQELVNMWKMVFRKDSSVRPNASNLLNLKWMQKMEIGKLLLLLLFTSNCYYYYYYL